MRVFICVNLKKKKSCEVAERVILRLLELEIIPMMYEECREVLFFSGTEYGDELMSLADFVVTIGGDGTILHSGIKAAEAGKAMLGVNTGRLGFMATLEADELDKLDRLVSGDYHISSRIMLDTVLEKDGKATRFTALNDVVLFKSSYSKLPEFSVTSNGCLVLKLRSDGVIISTPTGSTAYSLSAGGPIIEPTLQCIELTTLCPHTVMNRPMLFDGGNRLCVTFEGYEDSHVFISIDGDEGIEFNEGDRLTITRSELKLNIIDINENSFYDSIHKKLMQPLK